MCGLKIRSASAPIEMVWIAPRAKLTAAARDRRDGQPLVGRRSSEMASRWYATVIGDGDISIVPCDGAAR